MTSVVISISKHKVHGTQQTQAGPNIVGFERLAHIENGKGHKDPKRNDFLGNLELPKRKVLIANPIGGYLKGVFEQSNRPTDQNRDPQGLG